MEFSHIDKNGRVKMVDVSGKPILKRTAIAGSFICLASATVDKLRKGLIKKGDALTTAQLAGIMAAKRTSDTIPLCHPLMIASVSISFEVGDDHVAIEAHVDCVERTGVEMEALHACSVAALTIYDMCKSADRGMTITDLALWEKTGGRSGTYRRASES